MRARNASGAPTVVSPPPDDAETRRALARHQRRRAQGVPTLTVLVGPPEEALRAWRDWVASMGWPPARVVRLGEEGARGPLPANEPTLYLCGDGNDGARRLAECVARVSHSLTSQGAAQAGAVVGVAVARAGADAYLRAEPHSRAGTMFAEGIVELAPVPATPDASFVHPTASLAGHGAKPETIARFEAAAAARQRAVVARAEQEPDDQARSAAERFLFDLLADLPETAGLFALNVRLGFCFGPMPAEVDLLAADLRLAVEIDGFHHFQDPDCYRRDRRKDALLQKQDYLVLRFLAEDVVVRLEEILEEIRAAVAFRRATRK